LTAQHAVQQSPTVEALYSNVGTFDIRKTHPSKGIMQSHDLHLSASTEKALEEERTVSAVNIVARDDDHSRWASFQRRRSAACFGQLDGPEWDAVEASGQPWQAETHEVARLF
jgi:hypothetical protein